MATETGGLRTDWGGSFRETDSQQGGETCRLQDNSKEIGVSIISLFRYPSISRPQYLPQHFL